MLGYWILHARKKYLRAIVDKKQRCRFSELRNGSRSFYLSWSLLHQNPWPPCPTGLQGTLGHWRPRPKTIKKINGLYRLAASNWRKRPDNIAHEFIIGTQIIHPISPRCLRRRIRQCSHSRMSRRNSTCWRLRDERTGNLVGRNCSRGRGSGREAVCPG
jgi:hypothetical protein